MKVVCKLHERAHEDTEGCPWCEPKTQACLSGHKYPLVLAGAPQALDDWLSSDDLTYGYVVEGQRCSVFTGRIRGDLIGAVDHRGMAGLVGAGVMTAGSHTYVLTTSIRSAKLAAARYACAYVGKTLVTCVEDTP